MTIHELTDTTSPGASGHEERAHWDAAIQPRKEEQIVQPCSDGHKSEQDRPVSNVIVSEANKFPSHLFPKKLWEMVENNQFTFILWSEGGKCIAINEDFLKQGWAGQGRTSAHFCN